MVYAQGDHQKRTLTKFCPCVVSDLPSLVSRIDWYCFVDALPTLRRGRGEIMKSNRVLKTAVVLALSGLAGSSFAIAADSDEQKPLAEVVVTAQKREQRLQDVPIVVTAVGEQLLQDNGVKDIKDLTVLTPGLLVTSTASEASTTARIRGIGTVGDNPGLESSVGIVIDGVYRPRNGAGLGDLGEIERVEVLKGPQGTLFGKNTSAGVINIITKKPTFSSEKSVEIGVGNYDLKEATLGLNGSIVDDVVAGRFYFGIRQRDGFLDMVEGAGNYSPSTDTNRDYFTTRGQLLFKLPSNFDLLAVADYTERSEQCCAGVQVINSAVAPLINRMAQPYPGVAVTPDPYARVAYANRAADQDTHDAGLSFELNGDVSNMALTSITAGREWKQSAVQDADFSTVDIWYRPSITDFRQLSEEIRLNGEVGKVNWLVGAFYAHEKLYQTFDYLYGPSFEPYVSLVATAGMSASQLAVWTGMAPGTMYPAGLGTGDVFDQSSDSFAIFTNDSIQFTDALEMTIGARFTSDKKDLASFYRNKDDAGSASCLALLGASYANPVQKATAIGLGCLTYSDPAFNNVDTNQSLSENAITGTAKLAYRFNPEVMSYVSYARGYKSSGFNLDRERNNIGSIDTDTKFDSEFVDSYELGAKTNWLNNALAFNSALFYQKYSDFQFNAFTGLNFVVTSIPEVVSQGVDVDLLWNTPIHGLDVQAGVTYADTKITTMPSIAIFAASRTSDDMSFAPKWSGSVAITDELLIGGNHVLRSNISAKYNSSYNTGSNLDPRKLQDAYTVVNARIGYGAADDFWMIEAWAMNLFDEKYMQVAFDSPLQGSSASTTNAAVPPTSGINAFLGAPLTVGLTARFKFK
jgi:iron complex outermembrane recepter protein